jgi:hypothetical protein
LTLVPDLPKPPRPPPPAPETLQGIGSGIREILIKVGKLDEKGDRLDAAVGRVEFKQNEQGYEINAIKRDQDQMKFTLSDHGDRLVDLERLPRARAPHSSEMDLESYNAEMTPAGGIKLEHAMWSSIMRSKADTERAMNELRALVEAQEEDRTREKQKREWAEEERIKTEKESDARIKKLTKYIALVGPVAVGAWEVARWLTVHFIIHPV